MLVVACSDGRLQEPLDEFLNNALDVRSYDRLYLPGGPGALSTAGLEYMRANRAREELQFLITAHQIEAVVLMYHCAAEDGPPEAICADYARIYPQYDAARIREQQERDTEEILQGVLKGFPPDQVFPFRMEVNGRRGIDIRSLRQ